MLWTVILYLLITVCRKHDLHSLETSREGKYGLFSNAHRDLLRSIQKIKSVLSLNL